MQYIFITIEDFKTFSKFKLVHLKYLLEYILGIEVVLIRTKTK